MRTLSESTSVEQCLETLQRCQTVCETCSNSRVARSAMGTAVLRCLRLIVQCAELCRDTAAILASAQLANPAAVRNHVRSCAIACDRCQREIERAGFLWAEECMDACARSAAACREILPTLPAPEPRPALAGRSD